jgi:hypothetical protein
MTSYRIQSSPDVEEGGASPPGDVVTIARAELDALRANAGAESSEIPKVGRAPVLPTEPSSTRSQDLGAADREVDGHLPGARAFLDPDARERESFYAKEIAAREQKVAELERAYRAALRDRELATALAGKPLVAGATTQLIKLWRDDFDAYEEEGQHRVCSRDGRTIDQAIAERLASPEYAHFCLPSSRGGAGAQDANRTAKSSHAGAPRNLGEAVVLQWREQAAARAHVPSQPIGWGRRR